MKKSRTISTMKNSIVAMSAQIITLFFSLVCRTVFVYLLGVQNLGYDALFSNILSVLSIVDLGITTALTYALYGCLHNKEYERVIATVDYFKRIFFVIGIVLIIACLIISPYVDYFINIDNIISADFLRTLFILYAINSFSTYFFVDMRTLITADQKEYILSFVDCMTKIITKILQIVILYMYRNYLVYMVIEIIVNLTSNLIIRYKVKKNYRIRQLKGRYGLSKDEKRGLFSNVFFISLNRIANTGINSTDNIIISKFVGTLVLGVYSNYNLVIGTGYSIIDKLVIGVTASLGDLFVECDTQKQQKVIFNLQFIDAIFSSLVFIFLFLFVPDVVYLWMGEERTLSRSIVFIVCFNNYFFMIRKTLDLIMQTKGVFKEIVPIKVLEMLLNIALSLIFVRIYGFIGVFIGTTVSILISFMLMVKVLIKDVFKFNYKRYILCQFKYFLVNCLIFFVLCSILLRCKEITLLLLFIKFLIASFLFVLLNILFYRKDNNFMEFKDHIIRVISNYKKI